MKKSKGNTRQTKTSLDFNHFAKLAARASGHSSAFVAAVCLIIAWVATGPLFGFSDTWQLVINTTTTIATFLMVFLIQNTQNRDSEALQVKVDELIRAIGGAHNALLNLEDLDEKEIETLREDYIQLAEAARKELQTGKRRAPGS